MEYEDVISVVADGATTEHHEEACKKGCGATDSVNDKEKQESIIVQEFLASSYN